MVMGTARENKGYSRMSISNYYESYWSSEGFYPHGKIWPELQGLYNQYIPDGATCLDVGCGDGRTSGLWLRDHGRSYIGVDVSANAISDAVAAGLDARKIEDATELPFADESFDAVICIEVLEHLFRPDVVATEMLRILRRAAYLS